MAKKKVPVQAFSPFEKTHEIKKIKLLVTIINRGQSDFFLSLYKKHESGVQMTFLGHGTASNELNSLLGIGEAGKDIILSVIREEQLPEVLSAIQTRFEVSRKAKGIAFTIPINSMIGVSLYKYLTNSTTLIGGK